MKKTIITFAASLVLTTGMGTGLASPLTYYGNGGIAIDLMVTNSSELKSVDDLRVTIGINENCAIQYNNFYVNNQNSAEPRLKAREVNVLYQLIVQDTNFRPDGENVSLYAGVFQNVGTVTNNGTTTDGETSSGMQIGIVGTTKVTPKMTAYASLGGTINYLNWKVGLSQKVAPNIEATVDYHSIEARNLTINGNKVNISTNGIEYGMTYKF